MKKILLLEDDPEVAQVLFLQFKSENYDILWAADAIQGLQMLMKEKPDLLLLDISVPAGSGFTLAERTRTLPQLVGIPFIFITAADDSFIQEKAEHLGAKAFIKKPYEFKKLLALIKKTIPD